MSYARFGPDSDVYVFESSEGFECCGCIIVGDFESTQVSTREEMLEHLHMHTELGHVVPRYAVERLRDELAAGKAK